MDILYGVPAEDITADHIEKLRMAAAIIDLLPTEQQIEYIEPKRVGNLAAAQSVIKETIERVA